MIWDFLVSNTCLREGKSKEYEEMWVFVKRRLVQARLQGQVPPKAPNKWQRCIVFESHSLESTGHHCGKKLQLLRHQQSWSQPTRANRWTLQRAEHCQRAVVAGQGSVCHTPEIHVSHWVCHSDSCLEQRLWLFEYYRTQGDKGRGQGMLDNC